MGTTSQKLTYLNTTKTNLKDMINYGLDNDNKITSSTTFRNYVASIFEAFMEALRDSNTLFTNLPKKTGSGSIIALNDTAYAPMRIVLNTTATTQASTPTPSSPVEVQTITGRQEIKTIGKNLLPTNIETIESSGLTFTRLSDGSYKINGTSNANHTFELYTGNDITIPAGTYTGNIGNRTNIVDGYIRLNNGDYKAMFTSSQDTSTFTITNTFTFNRFYIYILTGKTFNNQIIKPQLESGSSATTYEPYQEQVNEINLGKNLFDKDNATILNAYFGTDTLTSDAGNKTTYIKCSPNTTYTISKTASKRFAVAYTKVVPAINTTIYGKVNGYDLPSITITTGSDALYLVVWLINSNLTGEITLDEAKNTLQIEKGTQATSYSEYFTPIELCKIGTYEDKIFKTTGKNLFDEVIEQGGVDSNGINLANTTRLRSKNYIPVKSNTKYYLNYANLTSKAMQISVSYYSTNDYTTTRLSYLDWNTTKPLSFTTPNNCKYIRFLIAYTDNSTISVNNVVANIMINEGNSSLEYEPYGYGEWYVKKAIAKRVLNGTENWDVIGDNRYWLAFSDKRGLTSAVANAIYSNYFKATSNAGGTVGIGEMTEGYYTIANYNMFFNYNGTNTDLAGFKTWLSTHNTIVYYALGTPTYTKLSDELQQTIESACYGMLSYKGQTNITDDTEILPFILDVTAIEDLS